MNNIKKERSSNFELLRIFAMLMIIAYHICKYAVMYQITDKTSLALMENALFTRPIFYKKLMLIFVISPFGKIGNAIFLTISGFFIIKKGSQINIVHSIKKLVCPLFFVAFFLTLVSFISAPFVGEKFHLVLQEINVANSMCWFVGYYFLVVLFAYLFLNKYLLGLDRKKYTTFLLVLFAVLQIYWSAKIVNAFANGLSDLLTGVFLFSVGGFISLYNPFEKIKTSALLLSLLLFFVLVIISGYNISVNNIDTYLSSKTTDAFVPAFPYYDEHNFIPLVAGIIIFELFRRIKMPNSKIINFISSSTFVIYLAHDNTYIHSVWKTIDWSSLLYYSPLKFIITYAIVVLLTFLFGFIVYLLYLGFSKTAKKLKHCFIYRT